ncbi:ribulose-1,5 bisphosphate carboxylase/oxygenase large subunit N-methyltransferase, chloroplastic isoform X2 [Solanum lycopersicum]|uniref:ribulose-1,5 bisphosphate carboxylase/oxygenase large subunit N-methyltransferase, chloroplastic isoform X2 n=1 Tax=Solanum lycopersicum TaxID=4081 RepID=UPI003749E862
MLIFHRIIYSNTWRSPCSLLSIIRRLRCQFSFSNCFSKCYIDEECNDFLLWLEHKAGVEISSLLSIGKFANGRSLVARHPIKPGDCLLRVPYNVQLAPDNLPRGINALLGDNVGNVAKVALLILYEQKLGKKSEWDPYISRLPRPEDMHNTIFWDDNELEMIQQSSLHQKTIMHKLFVEQEFSTIKELGKVSISLSASFQFSGIIQDVTLENFKYACALVTSRAWESSRGVSMIPFADFANHSDLSDTTVLCSEKKQLSEVIADYSYAPGDQMFIRYGNFSNARLLLDFGFTLPCNMYDQVEVELTIPHEDKLRQLKLKLLSKHQIPILKDVNGFSSSENSSALKEVRFADAQGRGIPQSIRAFARVLCSNSPQEINYLAMEAAENDGRVARRPLKDKSREIQAHQFLLSKITGLIDEYNASIKSLELPTLCLVGKHDMRRQMAQYLLTGYIVCSHVDADIILGKGRSIFSFLKCLNCNFMGNNIIRINYNTVGFVKFSFITWRMTRCMKHGKRGKDD